MRFRTYAISGFTIIWSPNTEFHYVVLALYTETTKQENDITKFTIVLHFFYFLEISL